jgi:hypothetical protein
MELYAEPGIDSSGSVVADTERADALGRWTVGATHPVGGLKLFGGGFTLFEGRFRWPASLASQPALNAMKFDYELQRDPRHGCFETMDLLERLTGQITWEPQPVRRPTIWIVTAETAVDSSLVRKFRQFARRWRDETAFISSVQEMVTNYWYQRIVGLGRPALPLILDEMRNRPDHWFWALRAISGEDPVRPGADFDEALGEWQAWGKRKGLLN